MSQASPQPTNNVRFYDFGPFRVDTINRLLLRDNQIVPLTAKVFDVLLVFVSSNGRMLLKDDLMKQVWPESFVEEGNLTRNVSTLRKALGESPKEHQYILTIPGRGYQFAPRVTEVEDGNRQSAMFQCNLWKSVDLFIREDFNETIAVAFESSCFVPVNHRRARVGCAIGANKTTRYARHV